MTDEFTYERGDGPWPGFPHGKSLSDYWFVIIGLAMLGALAIAQYLSGSGAK